MNNLYFFQVCLTVGVVLIVLGLMFKAEGAIIGGVIAAACSLAGLLMLR